MTCSASVLLFAISKHASTRPTVETLGLFHFREATRSPFLHRVLRLTPEYVLQLLPRHQLLLKIQTFRKSDPFCVDDKRGREILKLSESFFVFMSLFMYSFIWTYNIWCLDMCFYIVVLILWFGTCFWVGMNFCMDKFLL